MNEESTLIKFYKELLTICKLEIGEDGAIYVPSMKRGRLPYLINGIQLYLPTKENIASSIKPDETGKLMLVKELFNPLNESSFKGENKSLLRLEDYLERLYNNSFAVVSEVLLSALANPDIEIANLELIKIIDQLNKNRSGPTKRLVDATTVTNFVNIYKDIMPKNTNELFIHTYLKRGGKIGNIKYNRVGVLSFPVLEKLDKLSSGDVLYGVKLRNKDIEAYKILYTSIFKESIPDLIDGVQLGSPDQTAPGTMVLLATYDHVARLINEFIDILLTLDMDVSSLKEAKLNVLPYTIDKLSIALVTFKKELAGIPSDTDMSSLEALANKDMEESIINSIVGGNVNNNAINNINNQAMFTPTVETNNTSNMSEEDMVLSKLLGTNINNSSPGAKQHVSVNDDAPWETPVTQAPINKFANSQFGGNQFGGNQFNTNQQQPVNPFATTQRNSVFNVNKVGSPLVTRVFPG